MLMYAFVFTLLARTIVNYVLDRMYSGRSISRTRMPHYLLIGSILALVACFDTIYGVTFKGTSRH